ncbi:hypothetical protein DFJ68_2971 [Terracoccus luteus]|jgi:hypothetical protein|uniref:Uncharacterized protein n=1 Tax=Terracoccus luteus TaxID=53356 RepID=A0A495Y4J7_9MICO|nr:hypothetical protein [Terracoccus luteus]RKT79498.1 hypothetical protein DFJ68_2971 [Terracoccus luteus]
MTTTPEEAQGPMTDRDARRLQETGDDVLAVAARQLRDAPVPGWTDISDSIKDRLKTVSRRSRPVRAVTDSGRTMFVADRVILALLRRAVADLDGCELDHVALVGEDDTCTGAALDVVGRYGQDYRVLADEVRTVAYAVFRDLLGPTDPPFGIEGVDVTVVDLIDETV